MNIKVGDFVNVVDDDGDVIAQGTLKYIANGYATIIIINEPDHYEVEEHPIEYLQEAE